MVDTVEATASIEELDVNPSKKASYLERKRRSEYGFSAEQLRTDIDYANLEQVTQENLKEKGPSAVTPKPNSKQAVMGQIEQILAEVFHYKTMQRYRDKITPEFIAVFNEAEQAMLLELVGFLDQYLVLQNQYVEQLLPLLAYEDSDVFFADIAAIPAVKSAMEAKDAADAAFAEMSAIHTNHSDLDVAAKVAKVIGANRVFVTLYLAQRAQEGEPVDPNVPNKISMPYLRLAQEATAALASSDLPVQLFALANRFDAMELYYSGSKSWLHAKKRAAFARPKDEKSAPSLSGIIAKFLSSERALTFSNMAESLSDEWMIEAGQDQRVSASQYITNIRSNATKISIKIDEAREQILSKTIELPKDEIDVVKRLTLSAGEIADLFRSAASDESVEPKELQAEPESVSSATVPELKVTTAARADVGSSSMPELKVTQAAEKPDVSALSRPELKRSASEPQLKKTQLARTTSIEKLSKVLGEVAQITATKLESVKDTINRFTGKSTKLSAAISFSDYVGTALHSVQIFQGIAKDQVTKAKTDRTKFENWEFTYIRKANPQANEKEKHFEGEIPKDSRDGDRAEIHHNGNRVCDVVAQKMPGDADNVASGVAVTVHRHEEADIYLAVHMMVQSLAKVGKKKVIVTVDLNSPEGRELALRYVKAILGQNAIPVLFDGDRELSAKETKAKIEELYSLCIKDTEENSIYKHAAEQYEETAKKIKREQKEDAIFIKVFKKLMETPITTTTLFMKDPNPPRDTLSVMEIVNRLGDISLIRRNLTMDDYVDKLIDCLRKNPAKDYASLTPDDLDKIKREVKNYFAREISEKPDVLNFSPKSLMAEIFNFSSSKLEDSLFLKAFDNLLQDIATSSDVAIKMQDPQTGEKLDAHQILTRLAQIAFVSKGKGMEQETFIDRALAFGLATLVPSARAAVTVQDMDDLKKELQEEIRLHLLQTDDKRDEAKFISALIRKMQDSLFLKAFDNFLRDIAFSSDVETKMQDPHTGEELGTQEILTRLAQIALIQEAMDEDTFLDKVISFAWASSPHLSGAVLSDQKRESLKKALLIGQLKPYKEHLDPAHIGEFAYKLVDIAQHEFKFGHVAEEIRGQGFLPHHHVNTKTAEHALTDSDGDGEGPAVFHHR